MRSMRIIDLANLNQTRTVTVGGTKFTINSRGDFISDATGTATCTPGSASADYIKTTTTVTWGTMGERPPILSESIVAPPAGSIAPNRGALAIQVNNSRNVGLSGVGLSGSGAGSFSGSTGPTGCVIFGDLPAGNYQLTPSAFDLVDRDGNTPSAQSTSVIGGSTNTVALQFDDPGSLNVTFKTMIAGNLVPSQADSVVVFNTGMTAAKAFGTAGNRLDSVTADPLFPFTSPDTVYAGTCEGDNPNPTNQTNPPSAPAMASVVVPQGDSADAVVQLPALFLTVWSGSSSTNKGTAVADARVRIGDRNCIVGPTQLRRTFTANSSGQLSEGGSSGPGSSTPGIGLPYSDYDICADNGVRRRTLTNVPIKDLVSGTTRDIFLSGTGSSLGVCP
jgi:hypothetical protein